MTLAYDSITASFNPLSVSGHSKCYTNRILHYECCKACCGLINNSLFFKNGHCFEFTLNHKQVTYIPILRIVYTWSERVAHSLVPYFPLCHRNLTTIFEYDRNEKRTHCTSKAMRNENKSHISKYRQYPLSIHSIYKKVYQTLWMRVNFLYCAHVVSVADDKWNSQKAKMSKR